MTVIDPPIVLPRIVLALDALATCVCEQLATTGAGPTCWCGLYPGAAVSWEHCGECDGGVCGMGYVRLARVFPYNTFPQGVIDLRCASPLAWAVEIGALRCLPQPADGEPPSPEIAAEATVNQMLDARAIWEAMKCCGLEIGIETYIPVGPEGGCVGGFWLAYLDDPS